jgi:uncharacterized protein (DUF2267 family)
MNMPIRWTRRIAMSAVGLESIDHTVHVTHAWINELDRLLRWNNKHRSFRLLRTTLQALRDWLPTHEIANFAAQLPELLRGVFYEGWRPAATPVRHRSKANFVERVDRAFQKDPFGYTEEAVAVVFAFLGGKISEGEIEGIRHELPADLRRPWAPPSEAAA